MNDDVIDRRHGDLRVGLYSDSVWWEHHGGYGAVVRYSFPRNSFMFHIKKNGTLTQRNPPCTVFGAPWILI